MAWNDYTIRMNFPVLSYYLNRISIASGKFGAASLDLNRTVPGLRKPDLYEFVSILDNGGVHMILFQGQEVLVSEIGKQ